MSRVNLESEDGSDIPTSKPTFLSTFRSGCWNINWLFHVVVGIILISIILGIVSIVSLPPASPNQATLHRLCDAGRRGSDDGNDTKSSPTTADNQQKILFHIYLSCEVGISISYIQFPTSQFRAINITFSFRTPTTSCLFIVEILLIVGKQNSTSASLCLDVETNNCISEQTFRCCWWTRK